MDVSTVTHCPLVLLLLLLLLVHAHGFLVAHRWGPVRYHTSRSCSTAGHALTERLSPVYAVTPHDQSETLQRLLRHAEAWRERHALSSQPVHEMDESRDYHTVPGCLSVVRVSVDIDGEHKVRIKGISDSMIAQGLLAVIAETLSGRSVEHVLSITTEEFITEMNLDEFLLHTERLRRLVQSTVGLVQDRLRALRSEASPHALPLKANDNALPLSEGIPSTDGVPATAIVSISEDNKDGNEHYQHEEDKVEKADYRSGEIAVLLSGGVDSSVALQRLLQSGHSVRAYYLKIWLEDELAHLNACPWAEDLQYATEVCAKLGVPLETLSLQREYWELVVQHTLTQAKLGLTPNPDVLCNSRIKFGMFHEYVGRFHAKIASGHYAQALSVSKLPPHLREALQEKWGYSLPEIEQYAALTQSPDEVKDQSYFLCDLSQTQLRRCLFPIGDLQKTQVRSLAQKGDLPTQSRKDSQGICFLGKLKFDDFVRHYLGERPGEIRDYRSRDVIYGEHRGLWFHTVGQRKGLGPLLQSVVHMGPWYVADKDIERNSLYVTNNLQEVNAPRLGFSVKTIKWMLGTPPVLDRIPQEGIPITVKLRHGPTMSAAVLRRREGETEDGFSISLNEKDKGIAPGQYAVIYEQGLCLGSAIIDDIQRDNYDREDQQRTGSVLRDAFSSHHDQH